MDSAAWDTVDRLADWITGASGLPPETQRLVQLLKLQEEVGEVAEAAIGALGQNPRKGFSHTWDDVTDELCDVIISAMVALTGIAPDARDAFAGRLARVEARSLRAAGGEPV